MVHHPEMTTPRPIAVPILLSAFGPKGLAITREIADGWMGMQPPETPFDWAVRLVNGTVLEANESPTAERVLDAAGVWQVLTLHGAWTNAGAAVDALPGGADWRASVEAARPPHEQHLTAHEGHCSHVMPRDRVALEAARDAGGLAWFGWVGTEAELRQRAEASAAAGVTELLYTPAGSDVEREIRRFADAMAPWMS